MLKIYGRRNSSNVIPVMWAVGELNLAHERLNIGGTFGGDDTTDYLALNPNGLIPTINDDGFVLYESHAIVRYLCRNHSSDDLYPTESQQLAIADQWMEWHKFHVMMNVMPIFLNLVRIPEEKCDMDLVEQKTLIAGQQLSKLDQHLSDRPYILGEQFSMADIPTGALMFKYFNLPIERPSLPNVEAWYQRLCERPAYQTHAMIESGTNVDEWLALEKAGA
ncbi:MAG: glutathione S-transferase [Gammaproteobacteria bacterium]|jgi:glutathione S-transferase